MPNAYWDDDYSWDGDSLLTWDGEYDTVTLPTPIKKPTSTRVRDVLRRQSDIRRSKSWDQWATTPTPTQARAYLGDNLVGVTFPFNPDTVAWDYQQNIFSQDTLGGRVVQLLSVGLNGMTVQGRAGSRKELQRLSKGFKEIMQYHVSRMNPVYFKVPSRNWNFKVYLQAVPQLSWDVAATSYPYQLNLLVDEDLTGVKTKEINAEVLQRLASGIGHDASKNIRGGDSAAFKEIVDMVVAAGASPFGVAGASTGGTSPVVSTGSCTEAGCTMFDFCAACLASIGVPTTQDMVMMTVAWAHLEGGMVNNEAAWNLWNSARGGPESDDHSMCIVPGRAAGDRNQFPAYCTPADGVAAFKATITNGYYDKVIAAMKTGNVDTTLKELEASPWCAGGCGYYSRIMEIINGGTAASVAKTELTKYV